MKPTVIHHPLKRIQFSYHSEADLSNFEKTFIERYKQLHDELVLIKDELMQLKPGIDIVMTELITVRIAFEKLQDKIACAELMFGIRNDDDNAIEYSIKPGEINEVLNEFQSTRLQYWGMMIPMHKLFNSVCKRFTDFDETVELFEKQFSEPLFRNFKIMEIDSRSFHKDMNEFRIEWMAIASLQDGCLDEYTEWVKQQTTLVNDSELLYNRIKQLFRQMSSAHHHRADNEFGMN